MTSTQKTLPSDKNVVEYLRNIEPSSKQADCLGLLEVFQAATKETPVMWGESIIGFGKYSYKYASDREGEWPLTGFAPRKNNITLYIMSGFDEYADASGFDPRPLLKKLGNHKTGKSCLYISSLDEIDISVLKQLISKSASTMKKLHSKNIK